MGVAKKRKSSASSGAAKKKMKLPFDGKAFVLTGKLESMTRAEAKKEIENRGGVVRAAVSKNTDVVVNGTGGGAKLKKAKKLKIEIWTEDEFKEKCGIEDEEEEE